MLYFCGNQIQTENTIFGHRVRNLSKTSFKSRDLVKSFHCFFWCECLNDIKTTCWHFLLLVCHLFVFNMFRHVPTTSCRTSTDPCTSHVSFEVEFWICWCQHIILRNWWKKHGIYFLIKNPYYHDQTENHIVEINASFFDVFLQAITITFVSPCHVAETSSSVFQRKKTGFVLIINLSKPIK